MSLTPAARRLLAWMPPNSAEYAAVEDAATVRSQRRGGKRVTVADVTGVLSRDALRGLDQYLAHLGAVAERS